MQQVGQLVRVPELCQRPVQSRYEHRDELLGQNDDVRRGEIFHRGQQRTSHQQRCNMQNVPIREMESDNVDSGVRP